MAGKTQGKGPGADRGKPLKPGRAAPVSGQYALVGPRGERTGEEASVIAGKPLTPPRLKLDDRGHAVAPTEAEMRGEGERIRLALAEIDAILEDPPGSDEAFWRAIDAGRPERPLFRGMY